MSTRLQGSDKNAQIIAKRYAHHAFDDETGEEYSATNFGDFATYMRHKKAKLQNRNTLLRTQPENRNKPQIFRGVVATVNGYTKPSLQELTDMVVTHGGIFIQYMDGKTAVTHIIATALTPKKMVELARFRVVKPGWVVECIKEGKLLPWEPWRVISESARQSKLVFTASQDIATPGPGTLGLLTQRPMRSSASYKDVITPGKPTPQPTPRKLSNQASMTSSRSSPRRTKSFTPSQSDIPDGQSFAVVIPRLRSTTPYNQSKPLPYTQDTIIVKWKPPPNLRDEQFTDLSPPIQDFLSSVPDSLPEDIPPSHQPEPPTGEEIPESSPLMILSPSHRPSAFKSVDEIPESSPSFDFEADDDDKFISSSTKYKGDEVENILRTLNSKEDAWGEEDADFELQLLSPQQVEVSDDESGRTLRHRMATEDEIPPTSPIDILGMGNNISGEILENMISTSASPMQEKHLQSKQETLPSPITLNTQRPLIPATLPSDATPFPSKKQKHSTLEEANASFLADPRVRNATVLNPDFLKQYYQESRLHHLSSWKAELKQKLQDLTQVSNRHFLGPKVKTKCTRRYILHADFDCFFAAISIRNHSMDLTGKPVVVTHGIGGEKNLTSEIASCNYKARESGVRNGMWMKQALELCPNIISLPYDFPAYEKASSDFYAVILDLGADVVQSVSVDEALIDVTSLCYATGDGDVYKEQAQANALASIIRDRVREKTRCEVSVGIGGNILLAKLALRKAKPAGQYYVAAEEALDFLSELDIHQLPGVGSSLAGRLAEELQITKVAELRSTSRKRLHTVVGIKIGERLWNFAHGVDHAEVGDVPERKSVGVDVSWGVRFETQAQVEEFLHSLAGELHRRLVEAKVKGKHVIVKVMKRAKDAPVITPKFLGCGVCDTYTKSVTLGIPTWDPGILASEAVAIVRGYKFPPVELRGLGLQMTKLEKAEDAPGTRGQRTLDFKSASVLAPIPKEEGQGEQEGEEPRQKKTMENRKDERGGKEENKPLPAVASRKTLSSIDPVAGPWAFIPAAPCLQTSEQPPASQSPLLSPFLVPSVSQIDPSVLGALPSAIRAGILAAASKNPSSRFKSLSPPPLSILEPRAGPSKRTLLPQPSPPLQPQPQPSPPLQNNNDLIPPSLSQIDPEFLASLTPELREEILREYRSVVATVPSPPPPRRHPLMSPRKSKGKGKEKQTRFPQSPRKVRGCPGVAGRGSPSRTLQPRPSTHGGSPTRGRGGRSGSPNSADELNSIQAQYFNIQPRKLFPQQQQQQRHLLPPPTPLPPPSYGSSSMSASAVITYTPIPRNPQSTHAHCSSNPPLKTTKMASSSASASTTTAHLLLADLPEDLDRTVLASLPPDILTEILTHHHCRKPQSNSSSSFKLHQLPKPPNPLLPAASTRCLHLPTLPRPPLPQRPHLQRVSTLPELRSLLESWVATSTTSRSGDTQEPVEGDDYQGPDEEDVDVLVQYLRQVVVVERDMEKARKVVEWFAEVVAELDDDADDVDDAAGAGLGTRTCRMHWQRAVERAAVDGVGAGCRERGVPEFEWRFTWGSSRV